MRQDFSEIEDSHNLISVPPGRYLCEIVDTRVSAARDGSPRWGMHWKVKGGELAGKTAAWDNLNWSERGLPRVKQILRVLGFETGGVLDLEPDDLVGRAAVVQVEREIYEPEGSDRRIERLAVPYDGYTSLEEADDGFLDHEASDEDPNPADGDAEDERDSMPF